MASPLIVTLTQQNFEQEVLKSSTPILVDFWATWCGPCKMIAPLLDELAQEYEGRVRIGKVDVDQESQLAVQYGVQAIPTLLLFKDGQVIGQLVGAKGKRDIQALMDRALS
ncbi:thioredoxin [Limisphaera ngatamarikiensis]|jgi:thioredoxin 1|uniref:Thioredoxin n=1 Tax=Limisphaera ngatamarikiensis TaxID=1324935 RepID=A0A6M1RVL8_9BACT|nr:thioredoxin [Limisphaera ngatamarikiensis]NGO39451.1 thioredoxin [Limisphaera ngatamarikiensis]